MYNALWTVSCVFLVFGILSCIAGTFLKVYIRKNEPYKGHTEARVVDIIPEPRSGEASWSEFRNSQTAVLEFYAAGQLIRVQDPADTYPCPYHRSQKLKVSYDVEAPEHFLIERKNKEGRIVFWLNVSGVFLVAAGCVIFLMYASGIRI